MQPIAKSSRKPTQTDSSTQASSYKKREPRNFQDIEGHLVLSGRASQDNFEGNACLTMAVTSLCQSVLAIKWTISIVDSILKDGSDTYHQIVKEAKSRGRNYSLVQLLRNEDLELVGRPVIAIRKRESRRANPQAKAVNRMKEAEAEKHEPRNFENIDGKLVLSGHHSRDDFDGNACLTMAVSSLCQRVTAQRRSQLRWTTNCWRYIDAPDHHRRKLLRHGDRQLFRRRLFPAIEHQSPSRSVRQRQAAVLVPWQMAGCAKS